MLFCRGFDFLAGYLVVTACYRSLQLVPTFSMNVFTCLSCTKTFIFLCMSLHFTPINCERIRSFGTTMVFLVFFIRVGRGFLTPIFYEDPPLLPTSFFKFCPPPSPPTSNTTALFVALCLWLNGDSATFDVLFYLIIFWIHSCRALVPCYVFYGTRCRVYRGMTHNAVFR